MFKAIRQRFRDAGTLRALHVAAEKHANSQGQREPGTEHFILAALELPDATAARAFSLLQITPDAFRSSIENQYRAALASVGLPADSLADLGGDQVAVPPSKGLYRAQPSARSMMDVLTHDIMKTEQQRDASAPLFGAHVLIAASAARHGVCTRTFLDLGVEPEKLRDAATRALAEARRPAG